jgi:hypothetical protein
MLKGEFQEKTKRRPALKDSRPQGVYPFFFFSPHFRVYSLCELCEKIDICSVEFVKIYKIITVAFKKGSNEMRKQSPKWDCSAIVWRAAKE